MTIREVESRTDMTRPNYAITKRKDCSIPTSA